MTKRPTSGPGSRPNPFILAREAVHELRRKRDKEDQPIIIGQKTAAWIRHQLYFGIVVEGQEGLAAGASRAELDELSNALGAAEAKARTEDDDVEITIVVKAGD